jgi:hypothetical protein
MNKRRLKSHFVQGIFMMERKSMIEDRSRRVEISTPDDQPSRVVRHYRQYGKRLGRVALLLSAVTAIWRR